MTYIEGRAASVGKRRQTSYIYAISSITLVLFVLGVFGILLLNAQRISQMLRETLEITIALKDTATAADIEQLQKQLLQQPYTKEVLYIDKEQAAKQFIKEYGEDFVSILNFNPLFNTLSLHLKATHADEANLKTIETFLEQQSAVQDLYYPENVLSLINRNVQRVSIILMVLGAVFLFITIALIDSTIKLSMYSSRFLIKSMQLVGATRQFISRPFIRKSIVNGLVSGFMACLMLLALIYFIQQNLPEFSLHSNLLMYLYIFFTVILLGILISWWSTKAAVIKYLKLQLDELY